MPDELRPLEGVDDEIVIPGNPDLPPEDSLEAFARNTAVMTVGTTLSRFTGFLRIAAQTAALGVTVSALADTYNVANTTPNIIYELALGGILTSVFVPLFVDWTQEHGRDASWEVADRVLTVALVGLSAIAILGAIFAPWIIRAYNLASPIGGETRVQEIELGTYFLRWFMPQIVFYGIGAVAGGLLNANRRFAAPMFAPILNNLVVIATFGTYYWLLHGASPSLAVTGAQRLVLAAGTTLGVVAMTVALWPSLRHLGYRWRLRFDWGHPALRRLARLGGWVLVYVAANQLAYFLIIVLNRRVQGGITAYAAAFIVVSLPHAIFVVSIFTALLPGMSAQWAQGRPQGVRELFSRGFRDTAVIILPAALGLVALALPISRLIFEHVNTGSADTDLIARTLQAFAIGLPVFSSFQLLTRTFYAMQDTRTPALVNIGAGVVTVGTDLLYMLVFGWGVPGLALGWATSYLFGTLVLLWILRGRLGDLDGHRVWATLGRTFPAALVAASLAWVSSLAVGHVIPGSLGPLLQVLIGVAVGVLAFLASALIFGIREVDEVKRALARRFRS
jgi:putative peptidoglycan lipid II flippase